MIAKQGTADLLICSNKCHLLVHSMVLLSHGQNIKNGNDGFILKAKKS